MGGGRTKPNATLSRDHQTDFYFKMGRDESHINVSFIVSGKVARRCWQITNFKEKGEPKREIEPTSSDYQPSSLPLGQVGSGKTFLLPTADYTHYCRKMFQEKKRKKK